MALYPYHGFIYLLLPINMINTPFYPTRQGPLYRHILQEPKGSAGRSTRKNKRVKSIEKGLI